LEQTRDRLAAPPHVAEPENPERNENAEGAPAHPDQDTPTRFDRSEPVGVLVLTPSAGVVSRLNKPFTTGGEPACLRYHDVVAQNAVLILMARVGDLPRLADKLSLWGFKRFKAIYALAPPSGPNLMDVDAIAICECGRSNLVKDLEDWPTEKDPLKLAESLLNEVAGRRVHLFAESETPGWECILGEANFSMEVNDQ
jgi:hypothetical protein